MSDATNQSSDPNSLDQAIRAITELQKTLKERMPLPKSPHEELSEKLKHQDDRLTQVEVWQAVWRWLLPIVIIAFIGFVQIIVRLFPSVTQGTS